MALAAGALSRPCFVTAQPGQGVAGCGFCTSTPAPVCANSGWLSMLLFLLVKGWRCTIRLQASLSYGRSTHFRVPAALLVIVLLCPPPCGAAVRDTPCDSHDTQTYPAATNVLTHSRPSDRCQHLRQVSAPTVSWRTHIPTHTTTDSGSSRHRAHAAQVEHISVPTPEPAGWQPHTGHADCTTLAMLTAQAQHPACADEAILRLQATVHVAALAYKGCVKLDALRSTTATS